MREIYEETSCIDWDKKVVVELSLLELQMIKDLVGEASKSKAVSFVKRLRDITCPYDCYGSNDVL